LTAIICAEKNLPTQVRESGRLGVDILLAPSLVVHAIDPIHAHMAIYRAAENGVTVVRQANNGLSFVADPYGRVWAAMDHWTASERVLLAQVPAKAGVFTIYPIIGDLFTRLAMVGFVVVAVWAVVQGRRAAKKAAKS